jgi:hypothetical protein
MNAPTKYSDCCGMKAAPSLIISLMLFSLVSIGARGQSCGCPQEVFGDTHYCTYGSCQGEYGIWGCSTTDNTSCAICGTTTPTCCDHAQVAFKTAYDAGDCTTPGCSIEGPSSPVITPTSKSGALTFTAPASSNRSRQPAADGEKNNDAGGQ